ncbi:hypothetical protein DSL72_002106 [Monilinia vaccinii-corymbosi]|uniref:Uncharacterized protein n=1 Tax=Monilinia vaccinii-corymbosi TaxID=61207 RepID=A0A8A3PBT7_9HELO|nr:hypothetical protein DSL72_002106 [Monilinia vaccinii-corymbosi]
MLASNLFMTVALGAVVSARAVEKSDRSIQEPINDPSPNRATSSPKSCTFTPSLPMPPVSFISSLPTSLHNYLPDVLLSHSIPPPSESVSTAPLASTISLSEETGDSSLQGIFLGLVYTPISKPPSSKSPPQNPESQPKPKHKCHRPRPTPAVTGGQPGIYQSWGHANNLELRSPIFSPSAVPHPSPDVEVDSCYAEAVEGIRESGLVEGTLEFADAGWRMRFLVWRVD